MQNRESNNSVGAAQSLKLNSLGQHYPKYFGAGEIGYHLEEHLRRIFGVGSAYIGRSGHNNRIHIWRAKL